MPKPTRPKQDASALPSPFAALAPLRDQLAQQAGQAKQEAERAAKAAAKAAAKPVVQQPAPAAPQPAVPLSDDELLALAFSGAQRVAEGPGRVAPAAAMAPQVSALPAQDAARLASARAEPDLPDFWQPGVDPQFFWALGGERPWQVRVRLSGDVTTLDGQLARAVRQARVQHHACVLIEWVEVSPPGGSRTCGEIVRRILSSGLAGPILGYMTAKPADGGTKALYVWVRPSVQG